MPVLAFRRNDFFADGQHENEPDYKPFSDGVIVQFYTSGTAGLIKRPALMAVVAVKLPGAKINEDGGMPSSRA